MQNAFTAMRNWLILVEMRIIPLLLLLATVSSISQSAWAKLDNCELSFASLLKSTKFTEHFVGLSGDRQVFYRHYKISKPKGTVVLLNGLIYDLENWKKYIQSLQSDGLNVVHMAFSAQPESLRGLKTKSPAFLDNDLNPELLAEEIGAVIEHAKIKKPIHLASLSFGAVGIEFAKRNKEAIDSFTLMAPLVRPLDHYTPQGQAFHAMYDQLALTQKMMDPFGIFGGAASLASSKESMYRQAVDAMISESGHDLPKEVSPETFKRGVVSMVMGARDFDLKAYAQADLPPINLMIAGKEMAGASEDQWLFLKELAEKNKGSAVLLPEAEHAVVASDPVVSGAITNTLISGGTKAGWAYTFDGEKALRPIDK
jgi:alpha-beta hydrolase superfamily lysophospholipase